jgi:hypothetical protein
VSPEFGSNGGGVQLVITGSNFEGSPTVKLGSASATVVSSTASTITVTSPKTAESGYVDVSVTTSGGTDKLTTGFYLFPDAKGKAGLLGSVDWNVYQGSYWTGAAPFGSAWVSLVDPVDAHYWQFFSNTADSCASNYSSAVSFSVYDLEVSTVNMKIGSRTIPLAWDAAGLQWGADLVSADFKESATYSLDTVSSASYPDFTLASLATTPSAITLTSPKDQQRQPAEREPLQPALSVVGGGQRRLRPPRPHPLPRRQPRRGLHRQRGHLLGEQRRRLHRAAEPVLLLAHLRRALHPRRRGV